MATQNDPGLKPASESIRAQLEDLVWDQRARNAREIYRRVSFSTMKEYPDAPNPVLEVSGFGILALPLVGREAMALMGHAYGPLYFAENQHRTFQLSDSQVSMANPQWPKFLSKVTRNISSGLHFGPYGSSSNVELVFKKAVIQPQTSSRVGISIAAIQSQNTFAKVLVFLPCKWEGGAVHVSHYSGLEATYTVDHASLFDTKVLAFYAGVSATIDPVQSGYRLFLVYDVAYTGPSRTIPSFGSPVPLIQQFSTILDAWNSDKSAESPRKLFFFLGRANLDEKLSRRSLSEEDVQKTVFFEMLAEKHDLGIALARAECYIKTLRGYDSRDYPVHRTDEDEDDNPENLKLRIACVVGLDGSVITEDLDCDEETEGVPAALTLAVKSGGTHEDQARRWEHLPGLYDYHERRVGTLLVLWPRRHESRIYYHGERGLERAIADLKSHVLPGSKPTPQERKLAKALLKRADRDFDSKKAVVEAALAWKDVALWTDAVGLLHCSSASCDMTIPAVKAFGFQAAEPGLNAILASSTQAESRLVFLSKLEEADWSPLSGKSTKRLKRWIQDQREQVLQTLEWPDPDEVGAIVAAVKKLRGVATMEHILIPSVTGPDARVHDAFLLALATEISGDPVIGGGDASHFARQLIEAALSRSNFHWREADYGAWEKRYGPRAPSPEARGIALIKLYIQACSQTGHPDTLDAVFARVFDVSHLEQEEVCEYVCDVLVPLTIRLMKRPAEERPGAFSELQRTSLQLYLDSVQSQDEDCVSYNWDRLLDASIDRNDASVFIGLVVPRLERAEVSVYALEGLVDELQERLNEQQFVYPPEWKGQTLEQAVAAFRARLEQAAAGKRRRSHNYAQEKRKRQKSAAAPLFRQSTRFPTICAGRERYHDDSDCSL
ncbi:hypothetical protein PsYK624_034360 [Phanerochaete sordida]|uniref:Uncharacterized protein n=1 Tax=Phanerochaete sordida TaxID=48140 RepID=A0A9P3G320_9APHY|nr:hypothetical protein PsYK624_034360 [Phanerochaete sordida]